MLVPVLTQEVSVCALYQRLSSDYKKWCKRMEKVQLKDFTKDPPRSARGRESAVMATNLLWRDGDRHTECRKWDTVWWRTRWNELRAEKIMRVGCEMKWRAEEVRVERDMSRATRKLRSFSFLPLQRLRHTHTHKDLSHPSAVPIPSKSQHSI